MATTSKILPATHNIQIKRGDTWNRSYTLKKKSDGSAIDLSLATILCQVRRRPGAAVELTMTGVPDITVSGAGNNTITIFKTVEMAAGRYTWDLQVTFSSGEIRTFLSGSFDVVDDTSRV